MLTTSESVSDAYGQEFSVHETGAGRLDIENAYNAKLIIMPPNFVANISSDNPTVEKQLKLELIDGTLEGLEIKLEGPEFIKFAHILEGNILKIKMNAIEKGIWRS